MNSAKNYVLVLLALTTAGGAAFAWYQYQELQVLRAAASGTNGRDALQQRIAALQKTNRELEEKLAANNTRRTAGHEGNGPELAILGSEESVPTGPRRGADRGAAFREIMAKPEVQALMNQERKAAVDLRYAALFRSLSLSPEQSDKLAGLLTERQSAIQDVWAAARDQGINPWTDRDAMAKLVADTQAPINDSIKSLLGDSGYSQLSQYEQTMPQRNVVNALQQRLSYTDSPLNSAQADQLVQILAATNPVHNGNANYQTFSGPRFGAMGGVVGPGSAPITSEAVNQAQTVLTPTQVTALQQLQQQQQTAQQLQQVMRNAFQQSNAGGPGATAPRPAPTPAPGRQPGG